MSAGPAEGWDAVADVIRLARMLERQIDLWRARRFALALCRLPDAAVTSAKGRWAITALDEIYDRPPAEADTDLVDEQLRPEKGDGVERVQVAVLRCERANWHLHYRMFCHVLPPVRNAAERSATEVAGPKPDPVTPDHPWQAAYLDALRPAADLFRCIFANPLRRVKFDPRWLTPTAVGLATAIHQEWAFDRLPILADALQDAGCANEHVLAHCRSVGPHARGCWVLEAVRLRG